jgi:hypothetical protein
MVVYEIISNDQIDLIQTEQRQTKKIVQDELNRLQIKKNNMDTESNNTDRMILLNQSFRDRQQKYLVIMVMFLIIFGICLAIVFFQNKLGIQSVFIDLFIVLIICIGIGTGISMVSNINSRDPIEFSKMGQENGSLIKQGAAAAVVNSSLAKGDLSKAIGNLCKGAECCGPGFIWSSGDKKCTEV